MLNNWQRIEQVIKWAGAASVSAFARDIGLNRGENLYQIKRGNNGISKELTEIITTKYPQVSKAWLLTGEGDMLPGRGAKERCDIPFYKTDVADIAFGDEMPEPEYHVSFPMFKGCEFASFTFSDAMAPNIPRGAVLFFRKEDPVALMPGDTYMVVSKTFKGVRQLRKVPENNKVRLTAVNSDQYDDIVIDIKDIVELYHVKGVLINK